MNKNSIKCCLLIFVVCLLALVSTKARAEEMYPSSQPLFTEQELDDLLAPIALYPDPLLAQMLPASTYTEEIADAYDWLNYGGSVSEIDWQNWDESVKAVAHYPDVLKMMAEYGDWTADLGDAFLSQPEDVTSSIQRLRWQARDAGNLESNNRQTIIIVGNYIEIVPAQPQYIYVPSYDPSVVYYERYYAGSEPFITFSVGLMIGGWLTMDFDWGQHHVIYHGWKRPGWVDHARPYVHVNNVYVQKSRPFINKNWRHDASHGSPESYRTARPGIRPGSGMNSRMSEIRGRTTKGMPSKPLPKVFGPAEDKRPFGDRGKETRDGVFSKPAAPPRDIKKQPSITVPDAGQRPAPRTIEINQRPQQPAPVVGKETTRVRPGGDKGIFQRTERPASDVSRGTSQTRPVPEVAQPPKTPSVTFGGYRGASEARGQSLRGQASRQSSERVRSADVPAAKISVPERKDVRNNEPRGGAPANKDGDRGNAPAGKDDNKGKWRR
ncbi:MAG: hypothetical protein CVU55_03680 [Deltaproteobacteria bacterium HGW-Deltaproteobacteria-13]|jgi:hypothetical protein|nr:MAG: hypothetical protein CVU55_03680 [Deltaproteobacteria bacterium HGW-Deltaproteobacteria-13]